jgi:ketosteroid isomerase-like protein
LRSGIPALVAVVTSTLLSAISGASAEDAISTADVRALLKLESDWVAAESRRDAVTLRAILDDRFIATFGGAEPLNKEAFINEETNSPPDPTVSQELSDRRVIVVGDTAVIVETDTLRGMKDGRPHAPWRFTVTYIKHGNRWRALAEQGGPIKP